MPTVLIWKPVVGHPFGHAALQTDKYHISLWPLTDDHFKFSDIPIIGRLNRLWPFKDFRFFEASIIGRLVFNEHLDKVKGGSRENPREPTSRHVIVNVTNEAINYVYEEFLCYNNIDPKEVTLEAANRKHFELCHRQLPLTRYSLVGDVIVDKKMERSNFNLLYFIKRCLTPGWGNIDVCRDCIGRVTTNRSTDVICVFYHKAQSCVSFCFNLIEMADPSHLVCLVEARNNTNITFCSRFCQVFLGDGGGICLEITVPNFEQHVVQKYWKEGCRRDHYDVIDFQKGSFSLMMSETILKKGLMLGPPTFFMAWLHDSLNFSFFHLIGLTWIIHLMYFALLYFVQIKLVPFVRIPKPVALICGVLFSLWLLYYCFSFTFIDFFSFFVVVISEFILRFFIDSIVERAI